MKTVTLTAEAADQKRGMTLDELGALIQRAHREDVPGETPVTVRIGWRGQIQKAEIRGEEA